jgi:excisionase family DNA binding protein
MSDLESAIWRAEQVAAYLRISKDTVYNLVAAGAIPALRLGRVLRFRRDQIEALGGGDA